MIKIKSNPTYSVTVQIEIDGLEKTRTVCELSIDEIEHLESFLDEETLNSFL